MLQFRPSQSGPAGHDDPMYSPERDIAYVLRDLAGQIPLYLNARQMPSWMRPYVESQRLTEAQLQETIGKLAESMDLCLDPEVDTMQKAMTAGGFWDTPDPAKLPVLAVLGLLAIARYHKGVREADYGKKGPRLIMATQATLDALDAGREKIRSGNWLSRLTGRKGDR